MNSDYKQSTQLGSEVKNCIHCDNLKQSNTDDQCVDMGLFRLSSDKKMLIKFIGEVKEVTIPAGIVYIAPNAFQKTRVEKVYIPDGVLEIGDNCFRGCKKLTAVWLSASLVKISDSAFRNTRNVSFFTVRDSYADGFFQLHYLLGGKYGKKPWKMVFNWFNRVNRFISRLQEVSNQEFLARVAREARRVDIKCAAIKRIFDQELLKEFARGENGEIREAAIKKLNDQMLIEYIALNDCVSKVRVAAVIKLKNPTVLREIAKNDDSSSVRKAAFYRLVEISEIDTVEMKEYLMSNFYDKAILDRITDEEDLIDLAILAEWPSVRIAAAEKLPEGKIETELLKVAAVLSTRIREDDIQHFQELCKNMVKENKPLLKKIATSYCDNNVRALTVQFKPSVTNLVESKINTGDNKVYFDDGEVYAITRTGECKIGYYNENKVFDENKSEIASFTHNDDGVFIQFNQLGQIACLKEIFAEIAEKDPCLKETCEDTFRKQRAKLLTFEYAQAMSTGYVEDTNYDRVAYLHDRSFGTSRERVLGMAAAFVCLQKFVWTDENKYSRFYRLSIANE